MLHFFKCFNAKKSCWAYDLTAFTCNPTSLPYFLRTSRKFMLCKIISFKSVAATDNICTVGTWAIRKPSTSVDDERNVGAISNNGTCHPDLRRSTVSKFPVLSDPFCACQLCCDLRNLPYHTTFNLHHFVISDDLHRHVHFASRLVPGANNVAKHTRSRVPINDVSLVQQLSNSHALHIKWFQSRLHTITANKRLAYGSILHCHPSCPLNAGFLWRPSQQRFQWQPRPEKFSNNKTPVQSNLLLEICYVLVDFSVFSKHVKRCGHDTFGSVCFQSLTFGFQSGC